MARGALPWEIAEAHPRLMLDNNYAVVGIMDTADMAARVVLAVNEASEDSEPYRACLKKLADWVSLKEPIDDFDGIVKEAKRLIGYQG